MSDLKDFIAKRRPVVVDSLTTKRREHQALTAEIEKLEGELAQLDTAGYALGLVNGLPRPSLGITRRVTPTVTIKEAVMSVLQSYPNGLPALQILEEINKRNSTNYRRTSLSPQLSRLKQEGKLTQQGINWIPVRRTTG
jgi:hypothetical protein